VRSSKIVNPDLWTGALKSPQNPHQVHEQPEAAPLVAPFVFQADAYRLALVEDRMKDVSGAETEIRCSANFLGP